MDKEAQAVKEYLIRFLPLLLQCKVDRIIISIHVYAYLKTDTHSLKTNTVYYRESNVTYILDVATYILYFI